MNTDRFIHKRAYTDAEYHEDAEQDLVKSRRFRVMLLRQNSLYKAGFRREKNLVTALLMNKIQNTRGMLPVYSAANNTIVSPALIQSQFSATFFLSSRSAATPTIRNTKTVGSEYISSAKVVYAG